MQEPQKIKEMEMAEKKWYIPKMKESKLLFGKYSQTNIFSSSVMQHTFNSFTFPTKLTDELS